MYFNNLMEYAKTPNYYSKHPSVMENRADHDNSVGSSSSSISSSVLPVKQESFYHLKKQLQNHRHQQQQLVRNRHYQ